MRQLCRGPRRRPERGRLRLPWPLFFFYAARMRTVSPGVIISRLPGRVLCAPGPGFAARRSPNRAPSILCTSNLQQGCGAGPPSGTPYSTRPFWHSLPLSSKRACRIPVAPTQRPTPCTHTPPSLATLINKGQSLEPILTTPMSAHHSQTVLHRRACPTAF